MAEPADETIEKELLVLERQYWQSERMASLSAYPSVVAGALGLLDQATLRKMAASGAWKLEAFELSNPIVRTIAPDVAIVAYQVQERLTIEGKTLTFEAADLSTWVRRDGRWTCTAHTESLKSNPFGRDRKLSSP